MPLIPKYHCNMNQQPLPPAQSLLVTNTHKVSGGGAHYLASPPAPNHRSIEWHTYSALWPQGCDLWAEMSWGLLTSCLPIELRYQCEVSSCECESRNNREGRCVCGGCVYPTADVLYSQYTSLYYSFQGPSGPVCGIILSFAVMWGQSAAATGQTQIDPLQHRRPINEEVVCGFSLPIYRMHTT